jgi:putative FmdB family regulatory protein
MPTYEYRCPKGHDFEKFYRSISAAPSEVACPICGRIAERQLSAGGGLVFKGSGFYITDYGKDGKKRQTPAASAGEGAPPVAAGESAPAAPNSEGVAKSDSSGKPDSKPSVASKPGGDAKPARSSKSAAKPASKKAKGGE